MVTHKHPHHRPPKADDKSEPDIGWGWAGGALVVIILVVMASKCSDNPAGNTSLEAMNIANADMSNAIAAQGPPPVEALSNASVTRGAAHYRLAFAAESFPGAMVYSQNCYDALGRAFTWAKLDRCGGFDMLAVRAIDDDAAPPTSERDYFQSEAAAGRYLAAATGAGEPADEADQRLSQLQARTSRERTGARRVPATDNDGGDIGNTVNGALDEPMENDGGE